jgi:nucleotide-binding universal stress UspA family protein
MYERLLVAVDHSEFAERVLTEAKGLATLSGGEVWVLHVQEHEILPRGGILPRESTDEASAIVDAAVSELARAGVKAHGELGRSAYGQAAQVIVGKASEYDAGLIVMGSRGRGDLAGMLLGSTAHKVIHLAHQPVLVVR